MNDPPTQRLGPAQFTQAGWESLKDLGAENAARHVARRIQFVNLGSMFGVLVTACWVVAAISLEFWPLVWMNLAAIVGYAATLLLNRRKRWSSARHVLFWTTTSHIAVLTAVLPGHDVDSHNWFLIIGAAAFLLPDGDEMIWRRVYAPISIALYFLLGFDVFEITPIRVIPAGAAPYVKFGAQVSFVTVSAFLLSMFYRDLAATEVLLEKTNQKSRALLRNILPALISERLETGEVSIADASDEVTILFADIVGFTPLAASTSAGALVQLLNDVFSQFDDLAVEFGVEKIKTIGDAYMAAAGVPTGAVDHASRMARFALAMRDVIRTLPVPGDGKLDLRIGLHAGPVVAGVIGKTKFSYDLWGDTVNTAARMESHSQPGRVQVSEPVYELLKDEFVLEPRGSIEIKGKGEMKTWFLEAARV